MVRIDHKRDAVARSFPGWRRCNKYEAGIKPITCYRKRISKLAYWAPGRGAATYTDRQDAPKPTVILPVHIVVRLEAVQRGRANLYFVDSSKGRGKQQLIREVSRTLQH